MGSTVFVKAKVHSFQTDSGRIGYVWSEQTYEKKEGPKFSHWCVMAVGYREQMIKRIFSLAASIPGGMLHVRNASARAFIKEHLGLLDAPTQLPSTQVDLSNSVDGFYSPITNNTRARVVSLLEQAGKTELAQAVTKPPNGGGERFVRLDLQQDLDLVLRLLEPQPQPEGGGSWLDRNVNIAPWQIVTAPVWNDWNPVSGPGEPISGTPFAGRADITLMETGLTGFAPLRYFAFDGQSAKIGCSYEIESALIGYAARMEIDHPGYYLEALGQLSRLERTTLPFLPDETVFQIDASGAPDWQRRCAAEVAAALLGQPAEKFSICLGQIKQALREIEPGQSNMITSFFDSPGPDAHTIEVVLPYGECEDQQQETAPRMAA